MSSPHGSRMHHRPAIPTTPPTSNEGCVFLSWCPFFSGVQGRKPPFWWARKKKQDRPKAKKGTNYPPSSGGMPGRLTQAKTSEVSCALATFSLQPINSRHPVATPCASLGYVASPRPIRGPSWLQVLSWRNGGGSLRPWPRPNMWVAWRRYFWQANLKGVASTNQPPHTHPPTQLDGSHEPDLK